MLTFFDIALLLLLIIFATFAWHYNNRKKEPPGPIGFPFLGMIPYRLIEILFSKWIEEKTEMEKFKKYKILYGPIWSFTFGNQRIITLSSWELINEAFIENGELFSGRPTNDTYKTVSNGSGLLFTDGEIWRGNRQMAIKALKELGMGKKDLENRICDEGDDFISYLEGSRLKNINLSEVMVKCVSNVVIRLVFDERNDYNDDVFKKYIKNLTYFSHCDDAAKKITISLKLFKTKIMKKLFPDVSNYFKAIEYCFDFIKKKCKEREKVQKFNNTPVCVYDYFYMYRFNNSSSLSKEERNKEIIQSVYDLFNAGIDTTSNLLSFTCLMLGKYQNIQTDLRNEIKVLAEDSRQINMDMRKKCPKTLSFIDEIQRFCCLVPKVHHRVLKKTIFHGYELYPNDIIFGDLATLYSDTALFENSDQFKPYRFTDESRTKYCPSPYLIPFGIGKRSCIGESIANMELFIFLAKLIYKFKISLTKETKEHFDKIIEGYSGIVHGPLDHYLNLELC